MDMWRSTCFYFLLIVFVILFWSCLCDCRHLRNMEKRISVNLDHSITKNNKEITKLEAPSTNKKPLSSQAHAVVSQADINGKRTKDDRKVKKKTVSSARVSRTWKVPKYSKKNKPISDQEHPGFNLDYMQPTTHPPHHN